MPNPLRWYRARRHARQLAAFRANLATYGITDADIARMAENARAVWATLPTAEEATKGLLTLGAAWRSETDGT